MEREPLPFSRWWLVVVGALAMGLAGTYQFVWSSLSGPLGTQIGASGTALGTVFTVFVVFQTASQFPAGWVRDRYGPRYPLLAGAVLLAAGYLGTATAGSVATVYLAYGVGGVGAGVAYTVALNTPVKWFDERRGLATGVVGTAYGGASFLLIPAVRRGLDAAFVPTLYALAVLSGLALLLAAAVLRDPPGMAIGGGRDGPADGEVGDGPTENEPADGSVDEPTDGPADGPTDSAAAAAPASAPDPDPDAHRAYTWRETIRTWQFWLLYAVFVVVNGVGLMLIGKAVAYAGQFGLAPAVATASASVIAISDAGGVLGGGWLSDRIGPIRTIAGSLVLCGIALGASIVAGAGGIGVAFVVLVGAAAFFRSPIFVVLPGLVGTYYGRSRSSGNYALLYSSKLWGGVFGGTVSSGLVVALGWSETFAVGAALLVAAGLATTLVRPV